MSDSQNGDVQLLKAQLVALKTAMVQIKTTEQKATLELGTVRAELAAVKASAAAAAAAAESTGGGGGDGEVSGAAANDSEHAAELKQKDDQLGKLQGDIGRLVAKISESQETILKLTTDNSQINDLVKKVKERDNQLQAFGNVIKDQEQRLSKAKKGKDDPAKLASMEAQLKKHIETVTMLNIQLEEAELAAETAKDGLFLSDTAREDGRRIIKAHEEELILLKRQIGRLNDEHDELKSCGAAKERDLQVRLAALEASKEELAATHETAVGGLRTELAALRQAVMTQLVKLETASAAHAEAQAAGKSLAGQLESSQQELAAAQAEIVSHKDAMHEHSMARKIEARKRGRLVLELKTQLKKLALHVPTLEAKLKQAEFELTELKTKEDRRLKTQAMLHSMGLQVPSPFGSRQSSQGSGGSGGSRGSRGSHDSSSFSRGSRSSYNTDNTPTRHSPSSSSSSFSLSASNSPNISRSSRNGNGNGPPASANSSFSLNPDGSLTDNPQVDPEAQAAVDVTEALSMKLMQAQNETHNLKRKMNAMREHMRLLEGDVAQKRNMIRNLARRIETGALTTSEMSKEQNERMRIFKDERKELQVQLFTQLELLLQETVVDNSRLKEDLKRLGGSLKQQSAKENESLGARNALQDELDAVRESYEELRDELDVAEMARKDSVHVLAMNEARIKELEAQLKQ